MALLHDELMDVLMAHTCKGLGSTSAHGCDWCHDHKGDNWWAWRIDLDLTNLEAMIDVNA